MLRTELKILLYLGKCLFVIAVGKGTLFIPGRPRVEDGLRGIYLRAALLRWEPMV
jgi:hypothetical protein